MDKQEYTRRVKKLPVQVGLADFNKLIEDHKASSVAFKYSTTFYSYYTPTFNGISYRYVGKKYTIQTYISGMCGGVEMDRGIGYSGHKH